MVGIPLLEVMENCQRRARHWAMDAGIHKVDHDAFNIVVSLVFVQLNQLPLEAFSTHIE